MNEASQGTIICVNVSDNINKKTIGKGKAIFKKNIMKWKFYRMYSPLSKGKKDFGVIHEDNAERSLVCIFEKDISDLEGQIVAHAKEMYDEIVWIVENINDRNFSRKETLINLKNLLSRMQG